MPLLEYPRYLVSRCASSQLGTQKTKLMVEDPTQAYFYALATRDAQWADIESKDEDVHIMEGMLASCESRRRAELCAEGRAEGSDGLWRKSFKGAEWMPRCFVGCVTHAVVRDQSTGVVRHDSAGSTQFDKGRLSRAFRVPRNVDMIVELNMAEEPRSQPSAWEDTELPVNTGQLQPG